MEWETQIIIITLAVFAINIFFMVVCDADTDTGVGMPVGGWGLGATHTLDNKCPGVNTTIFKYLPNTYTNANYPIINDANANVSLQGNAAAATGSSQANIPGLPDYIRDLGNVFNLVINLFTGYAVILAAIGVPVLFAAFIAGILGIIQLLGLFILVREFLKAIPFVGALLGV